MAFLAVSRDNGKPFVEDIDMQESDRMLAQLRMVEMTGWGYSKRQTNIREAVMS